MSEGAVELVREIVAAINRGDLEAVLDRASADVEYDLSRTISPLRGVYRGVDEVRRVAEEFWGPWETVGYEIHEYVEIGEHVVTPFRSRFSGREGIELATEATWVWTIRDGLFARLRLFQDEAEATAAARAEAG